jgi:hypothetical protein
MTLDEIVSDYIREYRDDARKEMRFFEIQRSASEAIRKAALCELPSGKRHPHQRRIPGPLLEQVEARLQGIGRKLARASSFAELHRAVENEIGGIKGIGALTVFAHRIGAHFEKAPERVYLHAGTRIGAQVFRRSCPNPSHAWHPQKSKTACAYIRMSFAVLVIVATPDLVLQDGNAIVGSDFGG